MAKLHRDLQDIGNGGAAYSCIKIFNNGFTVASVILALLENEENNSIFIAQAVLTFISILFDFVLSEVKSRKLINAREEKYNRPLTPPGAVVPPPPPAGEVNYIAHERCYPEYLLPLFGLLVGCAVEITGLLLSNNQKIARKILKTVAAPISSIFYTANTDGVDHELSRLDKITNKSLPSSYVP